MALTDDFLDAAGMAASRVPGPRVIPWPMRGNLGGFRSFDTFDDWRAFWLSFELSHGIPRYVLGGFERAQKLFLLAWVDFDLASAGELVAFTILEYALKDRYLGKERERRRAAVEAKAKSAGRPVARREKEWTERISFQDLLRYMVEQDGLTDEKVGLVRRSGGTVQQLLMGDRDPSLSDMRNNRAHGNPFGSGLEAGLLELIRDLTDYAYRDMIVQRGG